MLQQTLTNMTKKQLKKYFTLKQTEPKYPNKII